MPEVPSARKVIYSNGDSEDLLLQQLGPALFLLEESSLLGHGFYHDSFRATPNQDGSLQFDRVVTPSGLCTNTWILSQSLIESDEIRAVLSDVMALGGNWEQAFGGVLLVHLPLAAVAKIQERITAIASQDRAI